MQQQQQLLNPIVVWLCGLCLTLGLTHYIDSWFGSFSLAHHSNSGSTNVSRFLVAYTSTLILLRWKSHGLYIFYELLWGCNMALIIASIGIYRKRPLLIHIAMCIVSGDQLCWYVDTIGYVFTKRFPLGVMKYLTYPENQSISKRWFASHHLWFLPLCLYELSFYNSLVIPTSRSFIASCVTTAMLASYSRCTTPFKLRLGDDQKEVYLNINGAFEFWKDVKISFLHAFDRASVPVYILFLATVINVSVNGIPSLVITNVANTLSS